jgi:hypothetical protein
VACSGHSDWELTSNAVLQHSRRYHRASEDLGAGLKAVFALESGFNAKNGSICRAIGYSIVRPMAHLASSSYGALALVASPMASIDLAAPFSGTEVAAHISRIS